MTQTQALCAYQLVASIYAGLKCIGFIYIKQGNSLELYNLRKSWAETLEIQSFFLHYKAYNGIGPTSIKLKNNKEKLQEAYKEKLSNMIKNYEPNEYEKIIPDLNKEINDNYKKFKAILLVTQFSLCAPLYKDNEF